ncbi:ABC transporter substrate-binding protein [Enterovirga rhinocerotis]|uniref:Iron complex transport system substrate-binding protein n=1 Tax=Enterovirga rhinocerotis TaxID=1339210 RepID=A0A4R7BJ39_9HYPH|nr:ABC transporter substrate-binding protein [Enterovirga rhinocerotis]TDR85171.1 iron complex transport system substrate-binding protein [Enterovirga rhinocerotis]
MRRRALLAGLGAFAAGRAGAASGSDIPSRLVALEWSIVSMLLSLGVAPVGMPEIRAYTRWVGEPPVPPGTADIGVKTEPNLEAVAALRPDLILTSPLNRLLEPKLTAIAPIREVPIYTEAGMPLHLATEQLREFGALLGRGAEAGRVIASAEAAFEAVRSAVRSEAGRPILLLSFLDAQHVRIFGRSSLFGNVLERVGLSNGWDRAVNLWGFVIVGLAELAPLREARLLVLEPIPPGILEQMSARSLWANLPAVRAGRSATIPAAWHYGDLTAARRFASFLPKALGSAA